jgi:hypothetical protein
VPVQTVDATPSNALIQHCFPGRADPFGCSQSKPSQGSVFIGLTLTSDLAFVFNASRVRPRCCVDPLRPPRLPGPIPIFGVLRQRAAQLCDELCSSVSPPRWYQYCYRGGARKPRLVIAFVELLLDFPDTGRRIRTIDPRGWHPFPLDSFNSQTGIAAHSMPHEWLQLFHVTLKRRTP